MDCSATTVDISAQPKQGRRAAPISSLYILCCLLYIHYQCRGLQQTLYSITFAQKLPQCFLQLINVSSYFGACTITLNMSIAR